MPKITQKDLKKYLDDLTEQELREEIKALYRKFPIVKEYYQLELSLDSTPVVEDYKSKIRRYYFPAGRNIKRPKAAKMRDLINQFKKVAPFPHDVIDLLLFQTETMIQFTSENGYVSAGFDQTVISRFKEATKLIKQEQAKAEFQERCLHLINEAEIMGWGPHFNLQLLYTECFEEEN